MGKIESEKQIALDTLKIIDQGYFLSPNNKPIEISDLLKLSKDGTKVYTTLETDDLIIDTDKFEPYYKTEYSVVNKTTLDIVKELFLQGNKDVLCLNFASAKKPGGYFLGESIAQEESIVRRTGLYSCLKKSSEYYETNRKIKSALYNDYMIYSPFVPIIKNNNGGTLETKMHCAVITAPAVNKRRLKKKEAGKIDQIVSAMKKRIKKVLAVSLTNNHKTLVLGAWGCGIFGNEPADIAAYFKEILESDFKNCFKKVVFAIYTKNDSLIEAFYNLFEKKD